MLIKYMDKIDYAIMGELQSNGRLTNQELAERVNLSPSPCLRRVRNLEEDGVIAGYRAVIDPKKYGLNVTIFARITLQQHNKEIIANFESAIQLLGEVMECYLLTGSADYLLRIMLRDLDDYDRFMRQKLHNIKGIAAINTSFAFGEIKKSQRF